MQPPGSGAKRVCALVLAGGRATRMGGLDKGLQPYQGLPRVATTAIACVRQQHGGAWQRIGINTKRHVPACQAVAPDAQAPDLLRPQPVFCLMRHSLAARLKDFRARRKRKIGHWTASQQPTKVPFNPPGKHLRAFAPVNTLAEPQHLENA